MLVQQYEVNPCALLTGLSAGVDQVLSIVMWKNRFCFMSPIRIHFLARAAGAFHPSLYAKALSTLSDDQSFVFFLQNKYEVLCSWDQLSPALGQFRSLNGFCVF